MLQFILYIWFVDNFGPFEWKDIFSSKESLKAFVKQFGSNGPLAFFVLQVIQVIVAPIPGNITALAGSALFGLWEGFFISTIGLIVGSCIAFWIARIFGRPVVERFVSKKIIDKYLDAFTNKHFIFLLFLFLFPFFPDDALCFIAGISALPFELFLFMIIIGRPPGMFVSSLIGSGIAVISWWEWAIIILISAAALYLSYRYKDSLEARFGLNKNSFDKIRGEKNE